LLCFALASKQGGREKDQMKIRSDFETDTKHKNMAGSLGIIHCIGAVATHEESCKIHPFSRPVISLLRKRGTRFIQVTASFISLFVSEFPSIKARQRFTDIFLSSFSS
jgi:hypothetical protein